MEATSSIETPEVRAKVWNEIAPGWWVNPKGAAQEAAIYEACRKDGDKALADYMLNTMSVAAHYTSPIIKHPMAQADTEMLKSLQHGARALQSIIKDEAYWGPRNKDHANQDTIFDHTRIQRRIDELKVQQGLHQYHNDVTNGHWAVGDGGIKYKGFLPVSENEEIGVGRGNGFIPWVSKQYGDSVAAMIRELSACDLPVSENEDFSVSRRDESKWSNPGRVRDMENRFCGPPSHACANSKKQKSAGQFIINQAHIKRSGRFIFITLFKFAGSILRKYAFKTRANHPEKLQSSLYETASKRSFNDEYQLIKASSGLMVSIPRYPEGTSLQPGPGPCNLGSKYICSSDSYDWNEASGADFAAIVSGFPRPSRLLINLIMILNNNNRCLPYES